MQTVSPNLMVGPYLVNVTGTAFASDVFLDVQVSQHGLPVADGSGVVLEAVPASSGNGIPSAGTPVRLAAVTSGGHAKLVPDISTDGNWLMTWRVSGPAAEASSSPQRVGIQPHRPADSVPFEIVSIGIPLIAVVVFLVLSRTRHLALEQWPGDRARTSVVQVDA